MELAATGNAVATFQTMSNELITPRILVCPQDKLHFFATNFETGFSSKNISYFVGIDADQKFPQRLLGGDDNFEINRTPEKSGLLNLFTNLSITWDASRHTQYKEHFWTQTKSLGNIAMSDGSVQQVNSDDLQKAFYQTGLATNRLALP